MNISIVIPAFNEEKYLGACLESILKNRTPELKEIIVVDNNSTDQTFKLANSFEGVTVVKEEKPGTNNARQKGFLKTSSELVAFIDADCHLTPNWLDKVQNYFNNTPDLVALSGPYIFYDLHSKIKKKTVDLWMKSAVLLNKTTKSAVQGGNLVIKKEILKKIGGFNTDLTFYGDDTEVAKRLSKFGTVKFALDFSIPSSARRLNDEGIVSAGIKYLINYLWVTIFKKPLHKTNKNIR